MSNLIGKKKGNSNNPKGLKKISTEENDLNTSFRLDHILEEYHIKKDNILTKFNEVKLKEEKKKKLEEIERLKKNTFKNIKILKNTNEKDKFLPKKRIIKKIDINNFINIERAIEEENSCFDDDLFFLKVDPEKKLNRRYYRLENNRIYRLMIKKDKKKLYKNKIKIQKKRNPYLLPIDTYLQSK